MIKVRISSSDLGIIIFDEIQQIQAKNTEAIETLLTLNNSTNVALAVSGTEDAYYKLFTEKRIARRLGIFIEASHYCSQDRTLIHVISSVFSYSWTGKVVTPNETMIKEIKSITSGVIDTIIKLYKYIQIEQIKALDVAKGDPARVPNLDAEFIRKTAVKYHLVKTSNIEVAIESVKKRDQNDIMAKTSLLNTPAQQELHALTENELVEAVLQLKKLRSNTCTRTINMQIPIIIPIMPDETLFSYIRRLAEANNLDMNSFCEAYVWRNIKYGHSKKLRFDTGENIKSFFDSLPQITDPLDFFFNHSVFRIYAPFLSQMQQTRLINTTMGCYEKYAALNGGRIASVSAAVKRCPKCMAEDIAEHGFSWYRVNHQVAGVCACHIHNCALEWAKPVSKKRYSQYNFIPMKDFVSTGDILFAKMVAFLSQERLQLNSQIYKDRVLQTIRAKFYSGKISNDSYETVVHAIRSSPFSEYFGSDDQEVGRTLKQILYSKGDPDEKLALLFFLYQDDISGIKSIFQPDPALKDTFLSYMGFAYNLESPYYETGVKIKHKSCGTEFFVTPYGFISGWECPKCSSRSVESFFEHVCRNITNERYTVKTPFKSIGETISLRHKNCGTEFQTTPAKFLYQGIRCDCERIITFQDAKKRLEGSGFKLLTFNGYNEPCRIRHIDMGHSFETDSFYNFQRHQYCRICQPDRALRAPKENEARDAFVQKIHDLTGDEYALISEYVTARQKVEILHSKENGGCGKTFSIVPDVFSSGGRCPHCTEAIANGQFPQLIHDMTSGVYIAESDPSANGVAFITDTRTGVRQRLTYKLILQELRRPTPSSIIPLPDDLKHLDVSYPSSPVLLKKRIHEQYKTGELVFNDEVSRDGFPPYFNFEEGIRGMKTSGEIDAVCKGVYRFVEDEWDTDEIVKEIFLCRRGTRIGYYVSDSYRWAIGLTSLKPNVMKVACCKRAKNTSLQPVYVKGTKVLAMGALTEINNDNAEIIALLHYISRPTNDRNADFPFLAMYIVQNGWNEATFEPYLQEVSHHCRRHLKELLTLIRTSFSE